MLVDYIEKNIRQCFAFEPTSDQAKLISRLARFACPSEEAGVLIVKGYAGTGKTSLIAAFISALAHAGQEVVLLAPTGRAAKVLADFAGRPAYTIHKKIYRQQTSSDGTGHFTLNINLHRNTLFVIDEASMISAVKDDQSLFGSGDLLTDLFSYIFQGAGCRLIFAGDTAQLPPVGSTLSPALDCGYLNRRGLIADEIELQQVTRQSLESGILFNATRIRGMLINEGTSRSLPKFRLDGFADIRRINGQELIPALESAYSSDGTGETIVISRSNKRVNAYNNGIRKSVLWREEELERTDQLMVVKNNYFWYKDDTSDFIANGEILHVERFKGEREMYGFRFGEADLCFPDAPEKTFSARLLLDVLQMESAALSAEAMRNLYAGVEQDYMHLTQRKQRYKEIRNNEWFNALQIKYAYAVTCHKAQGGQWKHVFIDQGYITEDKADREYLRWLYTAFTRATSCVYLVNFHDDLFD